jgi:hypothetical protein
VAAHNRPKISVAAAAGLVEATNSAGGDPDQILGALGLDRQALCDRHGFIAAADFARVLD